MPPPALTVRVDWNLDGDFTDAIESCSGRVLDEGLTFTRGRSADFRAEATGSASFKLDNFDDRYTPDRNWHDNPSFEGGTTGWSAAAIASLVAAATSISQVTDNAPSAGTKAGEAVLTATLNSGVTYPIPYRFRSGVTYAITVYLKSVSGNLNVRAGMASAGTPADIASSGANITTSWAAYTFTWTPSADRADGVLFVRTTTASAATLRIDAVQVNPGATSNTYIEAPTKGQLVPGRPVHIYSTYSAVDYPHFFGYIQRLTPDPVNRIVTITCYDVFKRMADTTAVVPFVGVFRSAREFRREILEEFARGTRNLASANPSFETNTVGWAAVGSALARITTDHAPEAGGTACGQVTLNNAGVGEGVTFVSRVLPRYHVGETYRMSVYLKLSSGTGTFTIKITGTSTITELPITVTSEWRRYTTTVTLTSESNSAQAGLTAFILSTTQHASVLLVDGLMMTRGAAIYSYADSGSGRWANNVLNGDFEGDGTSGWTEAWQNLITNPSFETDLTGWSAAGDAFVNAPTSQTRTVGSAQFGTARNVVVTSTSNQGIFFAITGTFIQGQPYVFSVYVRKDAGGADAGSQIGIGSQGTPADVALSSAGTMPASFTRIQIQWIPSANRTDVHAFLRLGATSSSRTYSVDGAMVTRGALLPPYADTGPLGGGTFPALADADGTPNVNGLFSQIDVATTAPFTGLRHLKVPCRAVANSGVLYNIREPLIGFHQGLQMSLSMYVRVASGTAPLKVGISCNNDAGGFDEASTTLTATTTYQRVTLTWTPSAERTADDLDGVSVLCTDASGPTIYVDGVRLTPGATPEDLELPEWALAGGAESSDIYSGTTVQFSGSVLSSLSRINAAALTRHWIEATMTAPFWRYVTSDRDGLVTKASAETFADDIQDMSLADIDLDSVQNLVEVRWDGGGDFYGDVSADKFGPRAAPSVDLSGLTGASRTIADLIGPALVARYKESRARPRIRVENRWPSQLDRELEDLVTVTFQRLRIQSGRYLILVIETKVTEAAQKWTTTYTLEEHAY